jgi:hypothetical protein
MSWLLKCKGEKSQEDINDEESMGRDKAIMKCPSQFIEGVLWDLCKSDATINGLFN